ncbi:MAG: glyoxalase/bleomycin resistance/dioxygenase family protein [Nitrospinaceae bacterium]|nr:glyoxalase/bleomycin resistance/dioxygenase family protein [Nitrospina sp.]MBT5375884.1 glyoxalase/bleomycin resistance/dioxygenase family protein [Nitrospinaceae bacterium]MBT6346879.1 glyoxalase/bleomycin resistance/dioxygenase family protein [Nitrospina sp.]
MKRTFKETSRLHLAINTNQFDKSIEFYEALFNIKPSKVKSGYAKFDVENPPINLTLNEASQVSGNQINHLGIEIKVSQGVKNQLERLEALGLETRLEENTTCCFAKQDKVWVTDPDGNAWETFVVLEDSELRKDQNSDSSCCIPSTETTNAGCC